MQRKNILEFLDVIIFASTDEFWKQHIGWLVDCLVSPWERQYRQSRKV